MSVSQKTSKRKVEYPFIHPLGSIEYVPERNPYLKKAREIAKKYRSNLVLPGAAVIVKDNQIIGQGSIGNNPAHIKGCVRVKLNLPTGVGYELCEGCQYKNHSEASAVRDAKSKGHDTKGAELYLWGHWWCCEPCWDAMIDAGIKKAYLLKNSEELFNKLSPKNIVGKQFAQTST